MPIWHNSSDNALELDIFYIKQLICCISMCHPGHDYSHPTIKRLDINDITPPTGLQEAGDASRGIDLQVADCWNKGM